MDDIYRLIRSNFNLDRGFELSDEMGPDDIPEWDSLGWITMLNTIQEKFNISITLDEAADIRNIGDIRRLIDRKPSNIG